MPYCAASVNGAQCQAGACEPSVRGSGRPAQPGISSLVRRGRNSGLASRNLTSCMPPSGVKRVLTLPKKPPSAKEFPMTPGALALQQRDQARRIPALAAHFLHLRIELVDQRRDRQMRAVPPRFVEADVEVLAHPIDGEAEIELAGDHGLVAVLHLPGLRRALGDGGDQLFDVEP